MRKTSNRTIKFIFVKNINTISLQYFVVIDENNNIKVKNMFKDS